MKGSNACSENACSTHNEISLSHADTAVFETVH